MGITYGNPPEPGCNPTQMPKEIFTFGTGNGRCGKCQCIPGQWVIDVPEIRFGTLLVNAPFAGRHLLRRGVYEEGAGSGDPPPFYNECHFRTRTIFEDLTSRATGPLAEGEFKDPIEEVSPAEYGPMGDWLMIDPYWTMAFTSYPGILGWLLVAGSLGSPPFGPWGRAMWGCGGEELSLIIPPEIGPDRWDPAALAEPFRCLRENTFSIVAGDPGHPCFTVDKITARPIY